MPKRGFSWLCPLAVVLLAEAVYMRPSIFGPGLEGFDFYQLHSRHINFARDALFGKRHSLPGWYPRELLGAPFWANIQSFPWIPSRLPLLLLNPQWQYLAAVAIAVGLAAIFMYLFCRRAALSEIAAMAAAWTFSCAGFFASRVISGHLPLLEAYASLPLLLWLADRAVDPGRVRFQSRDLAVLALACACVALAGHPQLPAYAIGTAVLYLLFRGRGRVRLLALGSLALGLGLTLFAWWPMLLLIQRSTRVLPLAAPENDVAMPYARLLALIWPAHDGWPEIVRAGNEPLFDSYPNLAYFWDTASYAGLLTLIALMFLVFRSFWTRRLPTGRFAYLTVLGIAALLLSLPWAEPLHHAVPATLLRSPARLLYLSTFCASLGLGCAIDALWAAGLSRRVLIPVVAVCLIGHVLDLSNFDRRFIRPAEAEGIPRALQQILQRQLGDARIAAENPECRELYDDVGIFDSILLAKPYRTLLRLAGIPPQVNQQRLDASNLPRPALEAAAARFVITSKQRKDLELVASAEGENLYRVPNPAPRASFVAQDQHQDLRDRILLPVSSISRGSNHARDDFAQTGQVRYFRRSSDDIRVEADVSRAGYVTVLESYDPGWTAVVDDQNAPVTPADGFGMAVPVPAGTHSVELRYRTPGRRIGFLLSLTSLVLLLLMIATLAPNKKTRLGGMSQVL